jgi:SWI/SNF-related matrix-associated actin-dependent regulator 1 of chromatin subfamily A
MDLVLRLAPGDASPPTFLAGSSFGVTANQAGFTHTCYPTVGWAYIAPTPFHAYLLWSAADHAADAALATLFPTSTRPSAILTPPLLVIDAHHPLGMRIVCVTGTTEDGQRPREAGFIYSPSESLWWTRDLRRAIRLRDLADPVLARRLNAVGNLPFDGLSPTSLVDLVGPRANRLPIVDPTGASTTARLAADDSHPAPAIDKPPDIALTFDREAGVWVCDDPANARFNGFRHHVGRWITDDPTVATRLRGHADNRAEATLQRAAALSLPPFPKAPFPPVPVPPGRQLAPEQVEGVHAAASRPGLLLADEMGVGKTAQALGLINLTRPRHVLVVVPAKLIGTWLAEAARWLVNRIAVAWRSRPNRAPAPGQSTPHAISPLHVMSSPTTSSSPDPNAPLPAITIVSYESLHNTGPLLLQQWDLVIADEIQDCLNRKSRRGKAFYGSSLATAARRLAMSGTPIWNRPQDLYAVLHWLAPTVFDNAATFKRMYGVTDLEDVSDDQRARLEWLGKLLRSRLMVRRLKADVLANLPPKTRELVLVDVTPEQRHTITGLDREAERMVAQQRQGTLTAGQRARTLAIISELRRRTADAKLPRIIADLRERLRRPDPLIIFVRHHHVADALKAAVIAAGKRPVLMTGQVTASARQKACDHFQAGLADVAIAGLDAAGVGYTMTAANEVWQAEMDWTVPKHQQSEDRAHRRGQTRPVLVRYYAIDGTIDARIARALVAKADLAAGTLGDHFVGFTMDMDESSTALSIAV